MSYSVPIGNRKMVNRCQITTLNRQYENQQKGDEHTKLLLLTDNTRTNRKGTNIQTIVHKAIHRTRLGNTTEETFLMMIIYVNSKYLK